MLRRASIHSSGRQEIVFFALVVGGVAYWRESRDRGVRTCLLRVLQADSQSGGAAPTLSTVGFPDSTVRESRERVRATIRNAGLEFPIERIIEAGLIGGGGVPHPGEISLARHGMLFLDDGPVLLTPDRDALPGARGRPRRHLPGRRGRGLSCASISSQGDTSTSRFPLCPAHRRRHRRAPSASSAGPGGFSRARNQHVEPARKLPSAGETLAGY